MINCAPRKIIYKRDNKALPQQGQEKNNASPKFPKIVDRIKEVLRAKNQREIAVILGVTETSVSEWKKKGFISIDTLLKISDISNASINWMLTGEGPKYLSDLLVQPGSEHIFEDIDNTYVDDKQNLESEIQKLNNRLTILETAISKLIRNNAQSAGSSHCMNEVENPSKGEVNAVGIKLKHNDEYYRDNAFELAKELGLDIDQIIEIQEGSVPKNIPLEKVNTVRRIYGIAPIESSQSEGEYKSNGTDLHRGSNH